MRLVPSSFNGFRFQQAADVSGSWAIPYDWSIQGITTNAIPRSQNFPQFVAKDYAGSLKVVSVVFNSIDYDRDSLVTAMDVLGADQHQLIATDEFGRSWYLNAVCIGINEETVSDNTASFGVVFDIDDPIWKKLIPSTKSIAVNITGNGTVTPIGNQPALPVITVTPTVSGSFGFLYKRFIQIINNCANALINLPLNLTGAGLDTSAIIKDNLNKCLVNVGGGINAVVTTIPYDTVTGSIPASGLIYIDTEQISYTSRTGTNFLGCTRGVNGTTAAVHADNAVIFTSKMAANGNDLRIYIGGVEVKRWFGGGGINSTTTKIFINWTQPANSNMTLGAVIAGAGAVATVQIQDLAANKTLLPIIPKAGNVLIGTEIFVYTGVDIVNRQLTGCTRAERQTSAGAHAVGDVIKFVTHDVWLYYGNPSVTPYVVDDSTKPILDLVNSTNTSWVYAEFYSILSPNRTGMWLPDGALYPGGFDYSRIYTATQNALADPASVIGCHLETAAIGYAVLTQNWRLYQPCGVTTITVTGKKYRNTALWMGGSVGASGLRVLANTPGGLNPTIWVESTPGSLSTWVALDAHAAVALGATYEYLNFYNVDVNSVIHECDVEWGDATLVIDSTRVPTITLAAELSTITLNSVLTNSANGYTMTLSLVMSIFTALVIDTKEKTIKLYDGTNVINALQNMPVREEWFPLIPNVANLITITDPNQATFAFSYEDRSL